MDERTRLYPNAFKALRITHGGHGTSHLRLRLADLTTEIGGLFAMPLLGLSLGLRFDLGDLLLIPQPV